MGKNLLGSLQLNRAYQIDCIEGMNLLPDKSIDMILCDLPYGTTACKWDTVIPFDDLWKQYERIIKDNGAIVLTASQPFTSNLITSNLKMFKYTCVWEKPQAASFYHAKRKIMSVHEDICIFYKSQPTYNPQMEKRSEINIKKTNKNHITNFSEAVNIQTKRDENYNKEYRYPRSVLKFDTPRYQTKEKVKHPTQKPLALFEYFIKTFTNENDIVLDNCLGSGTTAVACELNNRQWIGFETEPKYIEIINKRLDQIQLDDNLEDYE